MKDMNKILLQLFSITLAVGFCLTSCEYSDLETYSGTDDVYFAFGSYSGNTEYLIVDSTTLHIGYDNKKDSVISIGMTALGSFADFDRPVHFELVDTLSTGKAGEDVELLYDRSFIKANSRDGQITVKLLETQRSNDRIIKLTFRILPNEYFIAKHFETLTGNADKKKKMKSNIYKVYFDSNSDMPILWADAESYFKMIFGEYSKVKYKFILETLRFPEELFSYDPSVVEDPVAFARDRFSSSASFAWIMLLNRTLNEYEAEHGRRLTDENGFVVSFPLPYN